MRSLVGEIVAAGSKAVARRTADQPPVPYERRGGGVMSLFSRASGGTERNMQAMGEVGTLGAIVDLLATSTAALQWRLYRRAASGDPADRTEVTSHAALDTWRRPNKFYGQRALVESGQQHVELAGECRIVIETSPLMPGVPQGLWPVRPDRITPVPSAEHFLAGYVYTGPDGEKIPLALEQVMSIILPNPMDPYRGMSPVASILADADSIAAAVAWNRNFFLNGAEPGGIIQAENRLSDAEFDEMRARWSEQHRGVSNAHRVAIIEQGKWVDRKYSHTDMAFAQLRQVSRDAIRERYRIHGHMMGDADDVNLANATAAEITFARRQTVPRADRWKDLLNTQYLPLFGATATDLEWDYDSPVAEDEASDAATFYDRARGVQLLVAGGFDGDKAAAAAKLPEMDWDPARVLHSNATIAGAGKGPDTTDQEGAGWADRPPANRVPVVVGRPLMEIAPPPEPGTPPQPQTAPEDVDLQQTQEAWEHALTVLLVAYLLLRDKQSKHLAAQVRQIVDGGDLGQLATMTVDTIEAQVLVHAAMVSLADIAAGRVVAEAAGQGVTLTAGAADPARLEEWAALSVQMLALTLKVTAVREAVRDAAPGVSGAAVADQVAAVLADLSDADVRRELGGVLTAAQNAGRFATFRDGPEASFYASEKLDRNTCVPCHQVNGRFLGTWSELAQVERMYPASGYVDCLGGPRCRGTVVAVWRPATQQTTETAR